MPRDLTERETMIMGILSQMGRRQRDLVTEESTSDVFFQGRREERMQGCRFFYWKEAEILNRDEFGVSCPLYCLALS